MVQMTGLVPAQPAKLPTKKTQVSPIGLVVLTLLVLGTLLVVVCSWLLWSILAAGLALGVVLITVGVVVVIDLGRN